MSFLLKAKKTYFFRNEKLASIVFYASSKTENYRFCLEFLRSKIHNCLVNERLAPFLENNLLIMNYYLCHCHNEQYIRFIARLEIKLPKNDIFLMIMANHALSNGSYKHALG